MANKPEILMILTSHAEVSSTGAKTGWYFPELAHPYHLLEPFTNITVASPAGGEAPLNLDSLAAYRDDPVCAPFISRSEIWKNTVPLSSLVPKADDFDAVLVVGGHGPMFDLVDDPDSIIVIGKMAAAGKVVSAVCHGPAALINVKLPNGEHLLKGSEVTALTEAEEALIGATSLVPFQLESKLRERGAIIDAGGEPFKEKVVAARGGKLITGRNPASSVGVAQGVKGALGL